MRTSMHRTSGSCWQLVRAGNEDTWVLISALTLAHSSDTFFGAGLGCVSTGPRNKLIILFQRKMGEGWEDAWKIALKKSQEHWQNMTLECPLFKARHVRSLGPDLSQCWLTVMPPFQRKNNNNVAMYVNISVNSRGCVTGIYAFSVNSICPHYSSSCLLV